MTTTDTPNPGSREAIRKGCTCPVIDNGHGKGYMGGAKDKDGNTLFVYTLIRPQRVAKAVRAALKGDDHE